MSVLIYRRYVGSCVLIHQKIIKIYRCLYWVTEDIQIAVYWYTEDLARLSWNELLLNSLQLIKLQYIFLYVLSNTRCAFFFPQDVDGFLDFNILWYYHKKECLIGLEFGQYILCNFSRHTPFIGRVYFSTSIGLIICSFQPVVFNYFNPLKTTC
jgi:hypothetical protein